MGQLTPGATLIYERVGDSVYSREAGSKERNLVGYMVKKDPLEQYLEYSVWKDMIAQSKRNHLLSDALSRAAVIYELSKESHD